MNEFFGAIFRKKKRGFNEKKSSNIMTKIASVIIAVVLWMYVIGEVNPEIISEINNIEVKLVNVEKLEQSGLVVMGQDYYSVNIKVRGRRSDVVNVSSKDINAIADIRGFGEGENSIPVEVNLPSSLEVETINPVQIKVTLDKVVSRSKPVEVAYTGKAAGGYMHGSPELSQTEIMVSGPEAYVEAVEKIIVYVDLNDSNQDIQQSFPIKVVNNEGEEVLGVTPEQTYINVNLPILRVKSVPINVNVTGNAAEGYQVTSVAQLPSKVEIKGRKKNVESIDYLTAHQVSIEGITATKEIPLTVDLPEGIEFVYSSQTPRVKVVVEEVVSKEFIYDLDEIQLNDLDNGYDIEVSDIDSIKLTVDDIKSEMESLLKEDINVSLDLSNLEEGSYSVKVNWNSEKELKGVKVDPEVVDVIITQKSE